MAKTNEAKLWQRIRDLKIKGHFTRIESSTLNGIPDVNACHSGAEYWLELKSNDLKNCGLSKWQINWQNKTLVPRALKLLSLNPVSRSTNLVTSFPDNDKGLRSILEEAASRVREARSSYLVSRTDSLDKC
jgi:hypothetical protein